MNVKYWLKDKWNAFKKFYHSSAENRMGIYNFLAFILFPFIGMAILYTVVLMFWV